MALYRVADNRRGHAHGLSMVGWYRALLGDYELAITSCEQALTLFEQLDDGVGQALTWHSLGYAHHHLGRHQRAIACYRHALGLFRVPGCQRPLLRGRYVPPHRRHPPRGR